MTHGQNSFEYWVHSHCMNHSHNRNHVGGRSQPLPLPLSLHRLSAVEKSFQNKRGDKNWQLPYKTKLWVQLNQCRLRCSCREKTRKLCLGPYQLKQLTTRSSYVHRNRIWVRKKNKINKSNQHSKAIIAHPKWQILVLYLASDYSIHSRPKSILCHGSRISCAIKHKMRPFKDVQLHHSLKTLFVYVTSTSNTLIYNSHNFNNPSFSFHRQLLLCSSVPP